jgi:hypothetical protein
MLRCCTISQTVTCGLIWAVLAFLSVQCVSEGRDAGLLVALVSAPDVYVEKHRLQKLGNSNFALEVVLNSGKDFVSWAGKEKAAAPADWQQLADVAGEQTMLVTLDY